jgi:hypothetical protein
MGNAGGNHKIGISATRETRGEITNGEFWQRGKREGKSQIGNLDNMGNARGNRKWDISVMWETPGKIAHGEFWYFATGEFRQRGKR